MLFTPKRLLIIAHMRTGATFLTHCLDSHPDVYCARTEPLNRLSLWSKIEPFDYRMDAVLAQVGYKVCGMKLTYGHVDDDVWQYARQNRCVFIHHVRENVVRSEVSNTLRQQRKEGRTNYPTHIVTASRRISPATLDAAELVANCRRHRREEQNMTAWLAATGLPVLRTTYAQIVGGEEVEARCIPTLPAQRICKFLDIEELPLISRMRKVNVYSMKSIVSNWAEVRAALAETEFAGMVQ